MFSLKTEWTEENKKTRKENKKTRKQEKNPVLLSTKQVLYPWVSIIAFFNK